MNIRESFEEIWPVPEGVEWRDSFVGYAPMHSPADDVLDTCIEWDIRLDTFARCQETTDVYVSLVDELVKELEWSYAGLEAYEIDHDTEVLNRAKQIMEQKK